MGLKFHYHINRPGGLLVHINRFKASCRSIPCGPPIESKQTFEGPTRPASCSDVSCTSFCAREKCTFLSLGTLLGLGLRLIICVVFPFLFQRIVRQYVLFCILKLMLPEQDVMFCIFKFPFPENDAAICVVYIFKHMVLENPAAKHVV